MKPFFKILFFVSIICCCVKTNAQQLPLYTNYLLNGYAYNPALAGVKPYLQANISYRSQWVGFEGAPTTAVLSLCGPVKKIKNAGIGALLMSDNSGLLNATSGYLSFAYQVKLTKKMKLGVGLSAGIKQFRVQLYDVRAYDAGDELLTGNILTANVFDANAGIYMYNDNFFMGISSLQMFNNKITWKNPIGSVTPHYYLVAGYNIHLKKNNNDFVIQPSILIKYNSPTPVQPEYNLKLIVKEMFWAGFSYRTNDAVAALFGVTLIKKLNIAYSYDFSISTIRKYNQGSHEIMLNYNFIKKKRTDADEEEFKIIDNSMHQSIKNKKPKPVETKEGETKPEVKDEIKKDESKNIEKESTIEPKKTEETKPDKN